VEKSYVAKGTNGKKAKEKFFLLQINMRFLQTCYAWMFGMFKNCIHSQLFKPIFCSRNVVKLR